MLRDVLPRTLIDQPPPQSNAAPKPELGAHFEFTHEPEAHFDPSAQGCPLATFSMHVLDVESQ